MTPEISDRLLIYRKITKPEVFHWPVAKVPGELQLRHLYPARGIARLAAIFQGITNESRAGARLCYPLFFDNLQPHLRVRLPHRYVVRLCAMAGSRFYADMAMKMRTVGSQILLSVFIIA